MSPASGTLIVSPGYFAALWIPMVRGRGVDARDDLPDAPRVLVINRSAARRYWPGADPVAGLRATALEVGMSPAGLQQMVEGAAP